MEGVDFGALLGALDSAAGNVDVSQDPEGQAAAAFLAAKLGAGEAPQPHSAKIGIVPDAHLSTARTTLGGAPSHVDTSFATSTGLTSSWALRASTVPTSSSALAPTKFEENISGFQTKIQGVGGQAGQPVVGSNPYGSYGSNTDAATASASLRDNYQDFLQSLGDANRVSMQPADSAELGTANFRIQNTSSVPGLAHSGSQSFLSVPPAPYGAAARSPTSSAQVHPYTRKSEHLGTSTSSLGLGVPAMHSAKSIVIGGLSTRTTELPTDLASVASTGIGSVRDTRTISASSGFQSGSVTPATPYGRQDASFMALEFYIQNDADKVDSVERARQLAQQTRPKELAYLDDPERGMTIGSQILQHRPARVGGGDKADGSVAKPDISHLTGFDRVMAEVALDIQEVLERKKKKRDGPWMEWGNEAFS
jgi:hypothetical protein